MKFRDIKVGDVVYIYTPINRTKFFFLPKKVISTTKTQFTIEGEIRFRKGSGFGINTSNIAYRRGEKFVGIDAHVCDQTSEYEEYKHKTVKSKEISCKFLELSQINYLNHNFDELESIIIEINKINHIINKNGK